MEDKVKVCYIRLEIDVLLGKEKNRRLRMKIKPCTLEEL